MNNQDLINKVIAEIAMEKGIKEYDVNQYDVILRLADMVVKNCSIPAVSGRVCFSSDCFYHDKHTSSCVGDYAKCKVKQTHR